MSKSDKSRVYYNAIAKSYNILYGEEQIKKILLVKKHLPKKGRVLDLGAGSGILNDFLDQKSVDLFSFDLSNNLLKLNNNRKERKIQGDICKSLPFDDNFFDYVCSFSVFQDIDCIENGFEEIKRVLKNSGFFILSFVKFSSKKEKIEEFIKKSFIILERIEEEKDMIYILNLI
jgi:ubiquinone/menaquinone biosynthesis C-methylase UbiE